MANKPATDSPSRPDWKNTHLWEFQPVRDILVVLSIFAVVWLGYKLSIVTVPILLALLLAYLFEPLVRLMTRRKWFSRSGAALLIIATAAVVIVVPVTFGAGFAVVKGASFASDVATNIARVQRSVNRPDDDKLKSAIPSGGWLALRNFIVELDEEAAREQQQLEQQSNPPLNGDRPTVPAPRAEADPDSEADPDLALTPPLFDPHAPLLSQQSTQQQARTLARQGVDWLRANAEQIATYLGRRALGTGAEALSAAVRFLSSLGLLVFTGLLTAFFFYAFCTGWGRVQEFWESLIPERRKGRVIDLLRKMDHAVAGFVRGRLTIVGILTVYMTVAYALIGVPTWYILGPVVGVLFVAPFVHIIGVPVAMLLMWLEPSAMWADWQRNWWWIVFAPIVVYSIAQVVDDYILSPIIQGRNTNMDVGTILFASIAGGVLAGVYGLILAIPVAACIKILMVEVFWPRFRAWGQGKERDFLPIGEHDAAKT